MFQHSLLAFQATLSIAARAFYVLRIKRFGLRDKPRMHHPSELIMVPLPYCNCGSGAMSGKPVLEYYCP